MKKNKFALIVLSAVLLVSIIAPASVFPASAASEGTKDMNEAAGGKNILLYPLFLEGGDGAVATEGPEKMFEYDKSSKYCSGSAFYAHWKYEKAYFAERIIVRTGNDNKQNPRRMGDGWTLSGSDNGREWTVIYTGKTEDTLNENLMYFYVDLPDNKTPYEYYKLEAGHADGEQGLVQLAAVIICVNESVEVPEERPYITKSYLIGNYGANVIEAPDFDSGKYGVTNTGGGEYECRPGEEVRTQYCGEDYVGRVNENGRPIKGETIGAITSTAAGEWVQYTVEVRRDGVYRFDAWVASGDDPAGSVEFYLDGGDTLVGAAESASEGWQNYSKVTAGSGEMTAGTHIIKAVFPTGNVNFQAFEVTRTGEIVVPTEEATEPEATEPETDDVDEAGDSAPAANVPSGENKEDGGNLLIFVLAGAGLLIVIVIIIVLATKKKKEPNK